MASAMRLKLIFVLLQGANAPAIKPCWVHRSLYHSLPD